MTKYRVFAENDERVNEYDGPVLIERHCSECGDALLGRPDIQGAVHCENGHCGTRSGVSYVGSDIEM